MSLRTTIDAHAVFAFALAAAVTVTPIVAETVAETDRRDEERVTSQTLVTRSDAVLGVGLSALAVDDAAVLPAGRWRFDLVESAASTWIQSSAVERHLDGRDERGPLQLEELRSLGFDTGDTALFAVDGEVYRTTVALARGLPGGLEVGVEIPWLSIEGGGLDGSIESFHGAFGYAESGRGGALRDQYLVYLRRADGSEVVRLEEPDPGIGDVAVSLEWQLPWERRGMRASLVGSVELPTGDEEALQGSGSTDVGLRLAWTREGRRLVWHAGAGLRHLGAHDVLGLDAQTVWNANLGLEVLLGQRWSTALHFAAARSPFRDLGIGRLEPNLYVVDLGLARRLGDDGAVFLALTENVRRITNSPDIGLHLGVRRMF